MDGCDDMISINPNGVELFVMVLIKIVMVLEFDDDGDG